MLEIIKPLVSEFLPFAQKRMGFKKPPRIFLKNDSANASNPLGKTAYYDPTEKSVTLYVTNRHPKDVMRSLSHELVHHTQNCNGEFDKPHSMGDGYAQNDAHLREMERQAYEIGNLCFRDWEDGIKNTTYYESLNKGANLKMSTKDWKNGELTQLLSEAWGFKFNTLQEFEEFNEAGEVQTEGDEEIEEVAGVSPRKQDRRSPKLQKDRRADSDRDDDDKVDEGDDHDDEEKMEEGGAAARTGNEDKDVGRDRMSADRVHEGEEEDLDESVDEDLEEAAKPDYIDLDKDGDKEESMKKAAADAKKKKNENRISEAKVREILQKAIQLAKTRKESKE
tara:strand:+ start:1678 stop:2685 length:1008 start_codon:yes stop_codon:yes gene_type:complete